MYPVNAYALTRLLTPMADTFRSFASIIEVKKTEVGKAFSTQKTVGPKTPYPLPF